MELTGKQTQQVAIGIREAVSAREFELLAFAILEQHLHCVAISEMLQSEEIVRQMKRYGSNKLTRSGLHSMHKYRDQNKGRIPSIWAEGHWAVFIDSEEQMQSAIRYVEQNPIKEGKRQQHWSFVTKPT